MSALPHTSSAVGRICAPAATKSLVGDRRTDAGVLLDHHLVAVPGELVDAGRGDRDAVLVVLDLAGDADLHDGLLDADRLEASE